MDRNRKYFVSVLNLICLAASETISSPIEKDVSFLSEHWRSVEIILRNTGARQGSQKYAFGTHTVDSEAFLRFSFTASRSVDHYVGANMKFRWMTTSSVRFDSKDWFAPWHYAKQGSASIVQSNSAAHICESNDMYRHEKMKHDYENANQYAQIARFLSLEVKLMRGLVTVTKLGNVAFRIYQIARHYWTSTNKIFGFFVFWFSPSRSRFNCLWLYVAVTCRIRCAGGTDSSTESVAAKLNHGIALDALEGTLGQRRLTIPWLS